MVRKVKGSYFLNRAEVVDYLMYAHGLKWCNTRWSNAFVRITFETDKGKVGSIRVPAYKLPSSKVVRIMKDDLDLLMG